MSEDQAKYGIKVTSSPRQLLREVAAYYAIIPESLVFSKNHSAIVIYAALDRTCNKGVGYISVATLTEKTGLSRQVIVRAKKWLIEEGFIVETFKGVGHRASEFEIPFQNRSVLPVIPQPFSSDTSEVLLDSHLTETNKTEKDATPSGPSSVPSEPSSEPPGVGEKRKTSITPEFILRMVNKYPDLDVNDEIGKAVSHKSYNKWDGKQRYIEDWLKRALTPPSSASPPRGATRAKVKERDEYEDTF